LIEVINLGDATGDIFGLAPSDPTPLLSLYCLLSLYTVFEQGMY